MEDGEKDSPTRPSPSELRERRLRHYAGLAPASSEAVPEAKACESPSSHGSVRSYSVEQTVAVAAEPTGFGSPLQVPLTGDVARNDNDQKCVVECGATEDAVDSSVAESATVVEPRRDAATQQVSDAASESTSEVHLRLQILDGTSTGERRVDVHIDSNATIADLKSRHFSEELARGWRVRCLYFGRLLADSESLAQLPSGAFLQCYLQRAPNVAAAEPEGFPGWARLHIVSSRAMLLPPCTRWQDMVFHSVFAFGLALVWSAYLSDPRMFDMFGGFALRFFSLVWVVVCSTDLFCARGTSTPERSTSAAGPAA